MLKQRNRHPLDWREFGKYYAGCVVGDHTVKTILLGMESAEKYFETIDSEEDLYELREEMKQFKFH